MDRELKVAIACFLIGAAALGATIPFETETYRVHNTSAELPDGEEYNPRTDTINDVVRYTHLPSDARQIYRAALEGDGTVTRDAGEGVSGWPYDGPTDIVVDRKGAEGLPPADEADPESRYDAMAIDTRTSEPPIAFAPLELILHAIGAIGILLGVMIGFLSE